MKRQIFLVWCFILFFCSFAYSATTLQGKITIEGKKEFIDAIIKPDAEFILSKDAELVFKGKVETDGSKKGEIRIRGAEGSKVRFINSEAQLINILFQNLEQLEFVESNVFLKNIRVEKAKIGLKVTKNTVGIGENLTIKDSDIGFVTELKAKFNLLNGNFHDNRIAFIADQAGVAEVKNSNFFKNSIAISINQDGGIKLYNSNIYDNEGGIAFSKHIGSIIANSTFKNNKVALYAEFMTNISLEKNQFLKNETAVKFFQLVNGKIRGNNFNKNKEALYLEKKCNPDIRHNTFTDNEVGIFCDFSSYPTITLNNFLNNNLHIKLGIYQSADFENRTSSYLTQMQEMLTQQSKRLSPGEQKRKTYVGEVFAKKNYWDEKTREEMDKRENVSTIYDGYDMKEVSYEGFGEGKYKIDIVVFKPYLTEMVGKK